MLYGLAVVDLMLPPPLPRAADRSIEVRDADGGLLRAFTTREDRWRLPTRVGDIDAGYLAMLLAIEDKRFHRHPGVDPLAAMRAAGQWIVSGEVISGASTLTMQVARLLEPGLQPGPGAGLLPRLIGKLAQSLRAVQLEVRLSKAEILDLYLTLAPFGGNLEGVRVASRAYFGHPPDLLSPAEAALLVALPRAPEALRPDRSRNRVRLRQARALVLQRAVKAGVLRPDQAADANGDPLPSGRRPAPFDAPHLAQRLVNRVGGDNPTVETWIDGSLQRRLQDLAARARDRLERGSSVALLVVERRDSEAARLVRAYVGSAGFFAGGIDGQVDMVQAVRSPGSTLKPLLYAMAFDRGIAHPETVTADGPSRFGQYRPGNFDGHYRGEISLATALRLSLNVPAVQVLSRVGPAQFASELAAAGAPLEFARRDVAPNLTVALGGAGISLEGLVTLYAGLADGGRVVPLQYLRGPTAQSSRRLVGPAAAWQVADILASAPRPHGWMGPRDNGKGRRIASKTGTSYGYRDAWAIGFDGAYTVGVWVGRPDGRYGQARSGRNQAAPLLYRAFDHLPAGNRLTLLGPAGARPEDVLVATGTGLPPPLRRLTGGWEIAADDAARTTTASTGGPSLTFPPDGATLPLAPPHAIPDRGGDTLVLRVSGGRLPLRWLVNGRPIESLPFRRHADWLPTGRGRFEVSVIDRNGHSDRAVIWLE